ncbi:hypothetical protein EYF80_026357 [Liparis tanakae]|uniref:Uncharacterized protein n=1 Tax=Liparis tanakae TaxID=230148 RepID=A0A4Z2HCP7_9TELE|nr:hypothetical protein EYF80_026357 [Liparis tanakae]
MGIHAAALVFQREEEPGNNSQAHHDSPTWSSHSLPHSSIPPGMISEVRAACIRASWRTTPSRETRPEASITGERGNGADRAALFIRQAGPSREEKVVSHRHCDSRQTTPHHSRTAKTENEERNTVVKVVTFQCESAHAQDHEDSAFLRAAKCSLTGEQRAIRAPHAG